MNDLESELNRAARDLPEPYTIEISVENGSGWVVLHCLGSPDEDFEIKIDDGLILPAVTSAIEFAIAENNERKVD